MKTFSFFLIENNYYQQFASADNADKLYRTLSMQLHPDRGGDKKKFQAMQNAYEQFKQNPSMSMGHKEEEYPEEENGMRFYTFKGLWNIPSTYGIEVLSSSHGPIIIVTDTDKGTSVTNAWPSLADKICEKLGITPSNNITWIEHYRGNHASGSPWRNDSYDKVIMPFDGEKFGGPNWQQLTAEELATYRIKKLSA